jgi:uncharacterized membrane protein YkvA (DUF1232 family)
MNQEPMPEPATPADAPESRVQELVRLTQHVLRLVTDRRIPVTYKLIPAFAVLYVLSPIDLIPDTVPILTQIDDLAVLLIAARVFVQLADRRLSGPIDPDVDASTVTTTWRVHEE